MSAYTLQKLVRDVNRNPVSRERYFAEKDAFVADYTLTPPERDAVLAFDVRKLYALGVHGLLLRPFTIIHKMSEPDYLRAIRGEA
jgi:Aromatic-ring-opening dioxygenase LigAB, LigA subunit